MAENDPPNPDRLSVLEYFSTPESLNPTELIYGVVREPAAPRYGHQSLVTHLGALLDRHVRERALGQVCVSPVDVVLDESAGLVVQPDIIFVSAGRLHIIKDRVWGPPDLAIEVLSYGTAQRDRTIKLDWYRHYGVRECWLVDPISHAMEVLDLRAARQNLFAGDMPIRSAVLPYWDMPASEVFA